MEKIVRIPEQVSIQLEGHLIKVGGPKGTVEKMFAYPGMSITINDKQVTLSSKKDSRNEKRILGTYAAHLKSMLEGAKEGYLYKLKICSGHFPMKVTVEKNYVVINNFLGEKIARKAKILPDISVKVEQDTIFVEGTNKENAGQTAANIEQATRITNRDRRVFQDGCYIMRNEK